MQINSSKPGFHDRDCVYPVGFKTTRKHLSMVDPSSKCLYESEILEVDGKPVFRVTCEHDNDNPIEDSNPNVSAPPPFPLPRAFTVHQQTFFLHSHAIPVFRARSYCSRMGLCLSLRASG